MYETAWLRHKIYMTGIISQQLAESLHINIFNIANLLRINCNCPFWLFIALMPWISAETGISGSRNKCFNGRLFYFCSRLTYPSQRGQMLYPTKQCDEDEGNDNQCDNE
ncbi:hypothetical protein N037_20250 [Enterobacter sp. EGD-HP1]|nr:hypothetical protein N037_20250 [Enterobacter sp. EGD-HP1]